MEIREGKTRELDGSKLRFSRDLVGTADAPRRFHAPTCQVMPTPATSRRLSWKLMGARYEPDNKESSLCF